MKDAMIGGKKEVEMKGVEEADLVPESGYLSGWSNIQFIQEGLKETKCGRMCNMKLYIFVTNSL